LAESLLEKTQKCTYWKRAQTNDLYDIFRNWWY